MTTRAPAVALAIGVVLAGCSLPLGDAPTPSQTATAPEGQVETKTATPTPTPTPAYPPGTSAAGITNASALVSAHARSLNRTGYVAIGTGNTSVVRNGFLVDVDRWGRTVVTAGSDRYYEVRRTTAGPVARNTQRYSNGSVELQRRTQNGEVTYQRRPPRPPSTLASVQLLESLLAAGDFQVTAVRDDPEPARFALRANGSDNATAVRASLPAGAEQVRSYEATVQVDGAGRVHSLNATIEFVIAGQNRTHEVDYRLARVGVTNVTRPDWVDEANVSAGVTAADVTHRVGHCSRFVVSTSG